MSLCDGRGLRAASLCSLGYGWSGHAALHLRSERLYVGAAARKVVLADCAGHDVVVHVGAAPTISATLRTLASCRAGDEVAIHFVHRRGRQGTWCMVWRMLALPPL